MINSHTDQFYVCYGLNKNASKANMVLSGSGRNFKLWSLVKEC